MAQSLKLYRGWHALSKNFSCLGGILPVIWYGICLARGPTRTGAYRAVNVY
jgi:hypothetical protein